MKTSPLPRVSPVPNAAWITDWEMPFEGGFTLLSKFGWANAATAGQICSSVFGKKMMDANNVRCHGRSMLDTGWASVGDPGIPYLRDRVVQGALVSRAGRWTRLIATDSALRFCPACLAQGFQSAFYQIDGFRTCPIHDQPLRSACLQCGCPSVRYAVAKEGFSAAFHCPTCMAPLAGTFDPETWIDEALRLSAFRHLAPIASWLMRLSSTHVNWAHWDAWYFPPHRNFSEHMRRSATLQVLANIVPPPPEVKALLQRRLTPQHNVGGMEKRSESSSLHRDVLTPEMEKARVAIYKAVRRYVLRRLRGCEKLALRNLADDITVLHGSWTTCLSVSGCPALQAFLLWRFHFEVGQSDKHKLMLRPSVLQWPSDGTIDASAWAAYCLESFHNATEVFDSWRSQAALLLDADPQGKDKDHARALHAKFAPSLSPSILTTFPAISNLNYTDDGGSEHILIIGPVATEDTTLMSQDKSMRCACKRAAGPDASVMRRCRSAPSSDGEI